MKVEVKVEAVVKGEVELMVKVETVDVDEKVEVEVERVVGEIWRLKRS